MAKGKGQVPLDILEKRLARLQRIVKSRGGKADVNGPTPKEWTEHRKPPKKKK